MLVGEWVWVGVSLSLHIRQLSPTQLHVPRLTTPTEGRQSIRPGWRWEWLGWVKKKGGRALSPQVQTENTGSRRDLGVSSMCQRYRDRGTTGHLVHIPILCSIAVWECFTLKHAPSCVCLSVCTIINKLSRAE